PRLGFLALPAVHGLLEFAGARIPRVVELLISAAPRAGPAYSVWSARGHVSLLASPPQLPLHLEPQRSLADRLLQRDVRSRVARELRHPIAGDEDPSRLRPPSRDHEEQVLAADSRHDLISDQHRNRLALEHLERLEATARRAHV